MTIESSNSAIADSAGFFCNSLLQCVAKFSFTGVAPPGVLLHGLAGSKFVVRAKAVIDHFWQRSNYSPVFSSAYHLDEK